MLLGNLAPQKWQHTLLWNERELPGLFQFMFMESDLRSLHHDIVAFVSYILPTAHERISRQKAFQSIVKVLQRRFHDVEALLFGSVANDLCLPDRSVSRWPYIYF